MGFGVIPNAVTTVFRNSVGRSVTVYCSFLQIYNEKIYDLLQDPRMDKPLNIRENAVNGIFVENLA